MFIISSVNERSLCVNCGSTTPVITALGTQWQEDCYKFEAILVCRVGSWLTRVYSEPCLKNFN